MKETLCWDCRNACGNCPWSDGSFTPVDGWNATPTIIHNPRTNIDINSFLVHECPLFQADDDDDDGYFKYITVQKLAKLINVSIRTVLRWSDLKVQQRIKEIGYKLKINRIDGVRRFYVRKVD